MLFYLERRKQVFCAGVLELWLVQFRVMSLRLGESIILREIQTLQPHRPREYCIDPL